MKARRLRRRYGRAASPSIEQVTSGLRRADLGPGGNVRDVVHYSVDFGAGHEWCITPSNRQRLDHYGNAGAGWSDDWYRDYADPMQFAVQTWLDHTFGSGQLTAQVGEKGHIRIMRAG